MRSSRDKPTRRAKLEGQIGNGAANANSRPSKGSRVVVVDGDVGIRRYLRWNLQNEGYRVREFGALDEAINFITRALPDLVILNLDHPQRSGIEIIHSLQKVSSVPIIGLSLASDGKSMIDALRNGADDYMIKPIRLVEFLARVHSTLRRGGREQGISPRFLSDNLEIDLVQRRIRSQGREVHFSNKPYEVLRVLVENAGKVVSHQDILKRVWGTKNMDCLPYLRIAIRALRQKLEASPAQPVHIATEIGVGYRLRRAGRQIGARPQSR